MFIKILAGALGIVSIDGGLWILSNSDTLSHFFDPLDVVALGCTLLIFGFCVVRELQKLVTRA